MTQRWARSLPALGAGALLSLAIVQGGRQDTARASNQMSGPQCFIQFEQTGGTQHFPLSSTIYVEQPLPAIGNLAACSLGMPQPGYAYAHLEIVQWDPVTLAPDPTTVSLRTQLFNNSQLAYNHARTDLVNPVVTRSVAGVAEPPRPTLAVQFREADFWDQIDVTYDPNGPAGYGVAQQVIAPSSLRAPLPGAHPVLSVGVCGGDAGTQALRVVQSVMTTNSLLDTSSYEVAQRFRVPVATTLRWVELAGRDGPFRYIRDFGNVAVLEGQNLPVLGTQLPPPMVEARMSTDWFGDYLGNGLSMWFTHFPFDHTIALLPDHDYWLVARTDHDYSLHTRTLVGGESADFTSRIGPALHRTAPGAPFVALPGTALSFRLIGEPIMPIDVPATTPRGSALRLGASPNPARGPVLLSWSGAKGRLDIDVLDARGRRVLRTQADSPGAGQWLFRGAGADGRPLAAGLYFVRATDRSGQRALERVVLVR